MKPILPSPTFVFAQPADALRLHALEQSCFAADRISLRSYRRLLSNDSARILMVLDAQAVGGEPQALLGSAVLLFRRRAQVARVYSIAVAAQARKRGVASLLLAEAERCARQRGCDRLSAEIRRDNAASLATFHRAGFVTCGQYENYYTDGMAAVRVQKNIK